MRYLDADATRTALGMGDAIAAMERAFGDEREVPVRNLLGPSLIMPGRVGADTGVKVVSTVPAGASLTVPPSPRSGRPRVPDWRLACLLAPMPAR